MKHIIPPWMKVLEQEYNRNIIEIPGPKSDPNILKYHQATTLKATDDDVAWCSSGANWVIQNCGMGYKGTQSAQAISWLNWGQSIPGRYGAIAVFDHGDGKGHVTFFLYMDEDEKHGYFVGGNQNNTWNISKYLLSDVADFRWPVSFGVQGGYG